jgi:hypothetical protein
MRTMQDFLGGVISLIPIGVLLFAFRALSIAFTAASSGDAQMRVAAVAQGRFAERGLLIGLLGGYLATGVLAWRVRKCTHLGKAQKQTWVILLFAVMPLALPLCWWTLRKTRCSGKLTGVA